MGASCFSAATMSASYWKAHTARPMVPAPSLAVAPCGAAPTSCTVSRIASAAEPPPCAWVICLARAFSGASGVRPMCSYSAIASGSDSSGLVQQPLAPSEGSHCRPLMCAL